MDQLIEAEDLTRELTDQADREKALLMVRARAAELNEGEVADGL
jgi:hypothetical protein